MRGRVPACAFVLWLLAGAGPACTAEILPVPPELWDRPRTGRAVMAVPAVRKAAVLLVEKPEARLTIRHPRGPDGAVQAEELRAWLVAHAIDDKRIALRAELAPNQPLELELLTDAR